MTGEGAIGIYGNSTGGESYDALSWLEWRADYVIAESDLTTIEKLRSAEGDFIQWQLKRNGYYLVLGAFGLESNGTGIVERTIAIRQGLFNIKPGSKNSGSIIFQQGMTNVYIPCGTVIKVESAPDTVSLIIKKTDSTSTPVTEIANKSNLTILYLGEFYPIANLESQFNLGVPGTDWTNKIWDKTNELSAAYFDYNASGLRLKDAAKYLVISSANFKNTGIATSLLGRLTLDGSELVHSYHGCFSPNDYGAQEAIPWCISLIETTSQNQILNVQYKRLNGSMLSSSGNDGLVVIRLPDGAEGIALTAIGQSCNIDADVNWTNSLFSDASFSWSASPNGETITINSNGNYLFGSGVNNSRINGAQRYYNRFDWKKNGSINNDAPSFGVYNDGDNGGYSNFLSGSAGYCLFDSLSSGDDIAVYIAKETTGSSNPPILSRLQYGIWGLSLTGLYYEYGTVKLTSATADATTLDVENTGSATLNMGAPPQMEAYPKAFHLWQYYNPFMWLRESSLSVDPINPGAWGLLGLDIDAANNLATANYISFTLNFKITDWNAAPLNATAPNPTLKFGGSVTQINLLTADLSASAVNIDLTLLKRVGLMEAVLTATVDRLLPINNNANIEFGIASLSVSAIDPSLRFGNVFTLGAASLNAEGQVFDASASAVLDLQISELQSSAKELALDAPIIVTTQIPSIGLSAINPALYLGAAPVTISLSVASLTSIAPSPAIELASAVALVVAEIQVTSPVQNIISEYIIELSGSNVGASATIFTGDGALTLSLAQSIVQTLALELSVDVGTLFLPASAELTVPWIKLLLLAESIDMGELKKKIFRIISGKGKTVTIYERGGANQTLKVTPPYPYNDAEIGTDFVKYGDTLVYCPHENLSINMHAAGRVVIDDVIWLIVSVRPIYAITEIGLYGLQLRKYGNTNITKASLWTALDRKLVPKVDKIFNAKGIDAIFDPDGSARPLKIVADHEYETGLVDDDFVQEGDTRIYIAARNLSTLPTAGDHIRFNDKTWSIVREIPYYSGEQICMMELQGRR